MQYLRTILIALVCCGSLLTAQPGESPLRTFGYFQNQFEHVTGREDGVGPYNSFLMQQLNLFFQKNLARDWSAFVNFELLNSYSSSRQWGGINLEEAWVKYRSSKQFNLKIGLQIPLFNNLNAIKNRTPLLPYIVRPLVYESSFNEDIPLEEYVPQQAFVQVYGFIPSGKIKIEHAVYLGNSPNINNNSNYGQTGVDTTDNFLVGGRLGIRYDELRAGISGTYEKTNFFETLGRFLQLPVSDFRDLPRYRLGSDLSFRSRKLFLEAEYIDVMYEEGLEAYELDKTFYYGTMGWYFSEQLLVYGTYWDIDQNEVIILDTGQLRLYNYREIVQVASAGFSYNLNDRIALKGQYGYVDIQLEIPPAPELSNILDRFDYQVFTCAVSIIF